jgi:hypothetical protein
VASIETCNRTDQGADKFAEGVDERSASDGRLRRSQLSRACRVRGASPGVALSPHGAIDSRPSSMDTRFARIINDDRTQRKLIENP